MSVRTTSYVNGQWVSSDHDPYALLEHARSSSSGTRGRAVRNGKTSSSPARPGSTPGIVTRTIVRSPIIKWIVPARIRSKQRHDVIFVGEDFIHLKEILPEGHLDHVATKADFGARIHNARAFGAKDLPDDPTSFTSLIDSVVKKEHRSNGEVDNDAMDIDVDQALDTLPPQMLLLTLASHQILVLFAREQADGTVAFHTTSVPLPADHSPLDVYGRHLAVDPLSRVVAVAPYQNRFMLYGAKDRQTIQENFNAKPDFWSPFETEKETVKVDGTILAMEFLHPRQGDDKHVILLTILRLGHKTYLQCWDWQHPGIAISRKQPFRLGVDDQFPCLVIPLKQTSDFMIVSEHCVAWYSNVLAGPPKRIECTMTQPTKDGEGRRKKKPLLWTSWARASRNPEWEHEKGHASFYLAREDGALHYVELNTATNGCSATYAGHMGCTIDTAFSCLEPDNYLREPDLLVSAGNESGGRVVKIGAYKDESHAEGRVHMMLPSHVESFPNWSPTMDCVLCTTPGRGRDQSSLYTTSSNHPFGSVSELRWGFEARIGSIVNLGLGSSTVTALWTWPSGNPNDSLYIVLSLPDQSLLCELSLDSSKQLHIDPLEEDTCGFDFTAETLAISPVADGVVVQITAGSIHTLSTGSRQLPLNRLHETPLPDSARIVLAGVHPERSLILTVQREDDTSSLHLVQVTGSQLIKLGAPITLDDEATCATFLNSNDGLLLLVGLISGGVLVWGVSASNSLQPIHKFQLPPASASSLALSACEDAVLLRNPLPTSSPCPDLLVCGLRDGRLYTQELGHAFDHRSWGPARIFDIGFTSVRIPSATVTRHSALLMCGEHVCRVAHQPLGGEPSLSSVWLTDAKDLSLVPPVITTLTKASSYHLPGSLSNSLPPQLDGLLVGGTADGRIVFCQLEETPGVIPRKIPVRGSPHKLLHSSVHEALIVASTTETRRTILECVDLANTHGGDADNHGDSDDDEGNSMSAGKPAPAVYDDFEPHERVFALLEWTYKKGEHMYCFIVVASGIAVSGRPKSGKVRFLKLKTLDDGGRVWDKKKTLKFPSTLAQDAAHGPAFSLASHWTTGQIWIGLAKDIVLMGLDGEMNQLRWVRICSSRLPSAATAITTNPPFVTVTTAMDSVYTFRFDTFEGTTQLRLCASDSCPRSTWHHLSMTLPLPQELSSDTKSSSSSSSSIPPKPYEVVLVSDRGRHVSVLHNPLPPSLSSDAVNPRHVANPVASQILMQAQLPRSLLRLRHAPTLRPMWHRFKPVQSLPHDASSTPTHPVPGILTDDIIGTSADGSVFGLSIVSGPALALLQYLGVLVNPVPPILLARSSPSRQQDLNDAALARLLTAVLQSESRGNTIHDQGPPKSATNGFSSRCAKGPKHHLHADCLAPLLDPAGPRVLLDAVRSVDGQTTNMSVYEGLARGLAAVKGIDVRPPGEDRETWERELVAELLAWVRDVMRPMF